MVWETSSGGLFFPRWKSSCRELSRHICDDYDVDDGEEESDEENEDGEIVI